MHGPGHLALVGVGRSVVSSGVGVWASSVVVLGAGSGLAIGIGAGLARATGAGTARAAAKRAAKTTTSWKRKKDSTAMSFTHIYMVFKSNSVCSTYPTNKDIARISSTQNSPA